MELSKENVTLWWGGFIPIPLNGAIENLAPLNLGYIFVNDDNHSYGCHMKERFLMDDIENMVLATGKTIKVHLKTGIVHNFNCASTKCCTEVSYIRETVMTAAAEIKALKEQNANLIKDLELANSHIAHFNGYFELSPGNDFS